MLYNARYSVVKQPPLQKKPSLNILFCPFVLILLGLFIPAHLILLLLIIITMLVKESWVARLV